MSAVLAGAALLGALVLVHELGHFLAAKAVGVRVLRFSLGFGPRLVGWTRGGTEYVLAAVPLGGYVRLEGEEPGGSAGFYACPPAGRAVILLGGSAANYLFALLVLWGVFLHGVPVLLPEVGEVQEGMPAAAAGMRPGDRVLRVDGRPIGSWEELARAVRGSGGRPLRLLVRRGSREFELVVRPRLVEVRDPLGRRHLRPRLGIVSSGAVATRHRGPWGAARVAVRRVWGWSVLTVQGIWGVITGAVSRRTIGGPLLIAQMAGQQVQGGPVAFFTFMALIHVNLGLINLLPLPLLDGGQLAVVACEAVRRRPLGPRARGIIQQVGLLLLGLIMALAVYNDLQRLVHR